MTPRSSEKPGEPLLKVSIQPEGNPEIFYSIQGEGVNIGVPTVFLRLALCNLRCDWCDTKYTWDWDHYEYDKEVRDMSLSAVEEEIRRFGCRHLVITGGEPLMQARQMVPLAQSLKKLDYFIEVESNGTLVPPREFSSLVDQWNVSPKRSNSSNSAKRREVPRALNYFAGLPNAYFKYVVEHPDDIQEIVSLNSTYGIASASTLLMPQAVNSFELLQKSGWMVDLCQETGFRFSTRLQVLLWGAKRGL